MAVVLPNGKNQFFDSSGNMLAAGRLYTYVPGTSTPKAAYTTSAGTTPHANPIVLDARGEAAIYWTGSYDVVLRTSADALIWGPERLDEPEELGAAAAVDAALRSDLASINANLGSDLIAVNLTNQNNSGTLGGFLQYTFGRTAGEIAGGITPTNYAYFPGDVRRYGAVGDGTTDDLTAFQNAVASFPGGGVILIPEDKVYRITNSIALHSGLTLKGGSNVDPYYGTKNGDESPALIFQATANTPVFTVGSGVCDVVLDNFAISSLAAPVAYTAPTSGKYGIKFEGSRPNSSYHFTLRNLTFYNFERAISVVGVDTGAGVDWQIDDVSVEHCKFFNNTTGVYFNTTNADAWKFQNCIWTIWTNGKAIHCVRSGYIQMDTCYMIPAETSAGVQATGNDGVRLGDYPDNFQMINVQAESIDYFLRVDTSTGFENVYNQYQLIGCIVEAPCLIERQCKIVSVSSRYTENVTCSGDDIEVHSYADSWLPTTTGFVMSGLRPRLFVNPGSTLTAKSVTGVVTATATTMFTLPASAGMYQVYAWISNVGSAYQSVARLVCDGTTLIRIEGTNGANLTITVSGRNVQCTQSSGVNQTVNYSYQRIA